MLRAFVIAVSGVLLALSLASFIAGHRGSGLAALMLWPAIVLAAVLFEWRGYKAPLDAPPGPDWEATPEKFTDPGAGEALTVHFQPSTGKRAYVKAAKRGGRASTTRGLRPLLSMTNIC
jgi:hypothetical protein